MKIYHTGTEELYKFDRVGGRVTIFFFVCQHTFGYASNKSFIGKYRFLVVYL